MANGQRGEFRGSVGRRDAIVAGVVAAGGFAATAAGSGGGADPGGPRRVLRIAHLTDAHMQDSGDAPAGLARCLRHAQEQSPDLVVFGGDNLMNVDGGGWESADRQLAVFRRVVEDELSPDLRASAKYVIGNHDIYRMHPTDGKPWAMDAFGLAEKHYTFDRAGWRFVVLDSTAPQAGGYKGMLDAEQFEWLTETVEETPKSTPICIISHIPILAACAYFDGDNEKTKNWVVPGAWMHVDARQIKDLFYRAGNVNLCLSGHIHLADTVRYLGTTYACNGAVSAGWWGGDYQEFSRAYGLVDLFEDGTSDVRLIQYETSA